MPHSIASCPEAEPRSPHSVETGDFLGHMYLRLPSDGVGFPVLWDREQQLKLMYSPLHLSRRHPPRRGGESTLPRREVPLPLRI